MKLKLLLIYVLISFFTSTILKSENQNLILNEDIKNEESNPKEKDLNRNKIHLVIEGDSLSSIARSYLTNIQSIIEANNLSDENYIYIGQKLTIPESIFTELNIKKEDPNKYHEVKNGETLTDISLLYGIKIDELVKINKIQNIDSINIGTKILLDKKIIDNQLAIDNEIDKNVLREYGPLTIKSEIIELKNNREIINALNNKGEDIILALDCTKKEIDVRAKGRKWKGWLPAKKEFEKNLLNDFCKEIND